MQSGKPEVAPFADVAEIFVETSWPSGVLGGKSVGRLQRCCRETRQRIDAVHDYRRYWADIDPEGAAEVRQRLQARRPWTTGCGGGNLQYHHGATQELPIGDAGFPGVAGPTLVSGASAPTGEIHATD